MEKESFENDDIAEILNREFVPIKVDREERPDVDRVYMTFVQVWFSYINSCVTRILFVLPNFDWLLENLTVPVLLYFIDLVGY